MAATVAAAWLSPAWAQGGTPTAKQLTFKQVRRAIDRGIAALYRIEPQYTFHDPGRLYGIGRSGNDTLIQGIRHEVGIHAVACWALLACGESYQNPVLARRLNWVLSMDRPFTFDHGMRAQMLAELPYERWQPWVRREAVWLSRAISDHGGFADQWTGGPNSGWGDHANGQYGVLGLWGCHRAGLTIDNDVWKRIDHYWRLTQQRTEPDQPAGWAIVPFNVDVPKRDNPFYATVSGPMTAAGVASLTLTERFLRGRKMLEPSPDHVSPQLRKGLAWLEQNFSLEDEAAQKDWYFYMWTVQRVGHATGYRTFNGIDWFGQATARMLNNQRSDGSWTGPKGALVSSGFAMLYLAEARSPLAIAKLRLKDGPGWHNRPHDLWNFADYISDQYEVSTTWQIVEPNLPVRELIESPILYLATDRDFELDDNEVNNLRAYIDAGGLLLLNPDGNRGSAVKAFVDLAAKLLPGRTLEPVDRSHELYRLHQKLGPGVQMRVIGNGIRPLLIQFVRDIGRDLQANDAGRSDSFAALSNIYLYTTGMNPRRVRLDTNHVVQRNENPSRRLAIARVKHSGAYDPEPIALAQLKAILANEHDVNALVRTVAPAQLGSHKLAFLTTLGDGELSDDDAAAIRRWVEAGGTLWVDAAGGSIGASGRALQMVTKIMPGGVMTPLDPASPIISGQGLAGGHDNRRVRYRLFALRTMGPIYTPKLQVIEVDGRPGIIFSSEDVTAGLAGLDHWGIFGYAPQSARNLVVNGALLTLAESP
ncbi:MAG: DUF4159 domain-containing protein [Phycisphaeraceae bacterium]